MLSFGGMSCGRQNAGVLRQPNQTGSGDRKVVAQSRSSAPATVKESSMSSAANGPKFQSFDEFIRSVRSATYEKFTLTSGRQVESERAFEQMRQHILDLYEGVTVSHSYVDPDGAVFDCVPVAQQPSARDTDNIATPPPGPPPSHASAAASEQPDQSGLANVHQRDNFGNDLSCPSGTIPMRRLTLEDLARFATLKEFFQKGPGTKQAPPNPGRSR